MKILCTNTIVLVPLAFAQAATGSQRAHGQGKPFLSVWRCPGQACSSLHSHTDICEMRGPALADWDSSNTANIESNGCRLFSHVHGFYGSALQFLARSMNWHNCGALQFAPRPPLLSRLPSQPWVSAVQFHRPHVCSGVPGCLLGRLSSTFEISDGPDGYDAVTCGTLQDEHGLLGNPAMPPLLGVKHASSIHVVHGIHARCLNVQRPTLL